MSACSLGRLQGVDFIGGYAIKPHLGSGADVFRGRLNGVYLDVYAEKSCVAAGLAMGNPGSLRRDRRRRQVMDPPPHQTCADMKKEPEQSG